MDLTQPILRAENKNILEEEIMETTELQRNLMKRNLVRSMIIAIAFMILEIVGGLMAGSLAIITDAAHVLSDVSGIAVSIFALDLIGKKPTSSFTYGFHQAEILGAMASVMIVWAMTGILLFEAYGRFMRLQEINGSMMVGMASIGLAVNLVMMFTLGVHHHHHNHHDHDHQAHAGHEHDHHDDCDEEKANHENHCHGHCHSEERNSSSNNVTNMVMRAAVIHIIGDILQSVGVLVAALLIWLKPFEVGVTQDSISKWNYADPFCTIMFSILVMYTTVSTVRQSIDILMHRAPEHVDVNELEEKLKAIKHVCCVHDVHVWALGSTNALCTAHIVIEEDSNSMEVLEKSILVAKSMRIDHPTFQIEVEGRFDHMLETFGNLHANHGDCCNDCSPRTLLRISNQDDNQKE